MYNSCFKSKTVCNLTGKMIVLDGIDGSGKTTHVSWIVDWLREHAKKKSLQVNGLEFQNAITTREPGGTQFGEILREIILHQDMTKEAETLLMFASRHQHLLELVFPALKRGVWVICDRFTDSTFAYQGIAKGVDLTFLKLLESYIQSNWYPDLTILFDLPVHVAIERRSKRKLSQSTADLSDTSSSIGDRFETQDQIFFERVRQGYLYRSAMFPDRYLVIDAMQNVDLIRRQITFALEKLL